MLAEWPTGEVRPLPLTTLGEHYRRYRLPDPEERRPPNSRLHEQLRSQIRRANRQQRRPPFGPAYLVAKFVTLIRQQRRPPFGPAYLVAKFVTLIRQQRRPPFGPSSSRSQICLREKKFGNILVTDPNCALKSTGRDRNS